MQNPTASVSSRDEESRAALAPYLSGDHGEPLQQIALAMLAQIDALDKWVPHLLTPQAGRAYSNLMQIFAGMADANAAKTFNGMMEGMLSGLVGTIGAVQAADALKGEIPPDFESKLAYMAQEMQRIAAPMVGAFEGGFTALAVENLLASEARSRGGKGKGKNHPHAAAKAAARTGAKQLWTERSEGKHNNLYPDDALAMECVSRWKPHLKHGTLLKWFAQWQLDKVGRKRGPGRPRKSERAS